MIWKCCLRKEILKEDKTVDSNLKSFRNAVYCLVLLACCLFLAACAGQKAAKSTEKGYRIVLKKWTREGKGYENFETKLIVKATFKTEEVS